jgi:hypothetical protein
MGYLSLNDGAFAERVTLAEAYQILETFIAQYNARGESSTVALLTDIGIVSGRQSADPAQLGDFLDCARKIIGARSRG